MSRLLNIAMIALLLWSCKTADPLVRVSKSKKSITVFSSDQKGSSLTHATDSRKIAETIIALEKKVDKDSRNVSLLLDLSRLYLITGEIKKARAVCERALHQELHNKKAAKLLGEIELASNNFTKAEIILYRLGGEQSKDPEIINLLGLLALKRSQVEEAFDLFNAGLKLDSDNIALRMNIGILHLQHRQMEQARSEFDKVLKLAPEHADAKLHLAVVYVFYGKDQQAEAMYKDVLGLDPDNVYAFYNLSALLRRKGELKEGLAMALKTLKSDELSIQQRKKAELLRDDFLAEIKKREEEERKKKELERQKKEAGASKSLAAKPLKEGTKPAAEGKK